MYCPQCGSLNQEAAITCHNCGTSLVENSTQEQEPISGKAGRSSFATAIGSLVTGILSFWPYAYMASRFYFPYLRRQPFLHSAFDLGCLGGIPLGLAGIILGMLAWRRPAKNPVVGVMAVFGILLGIGGIAGHAWFIATCQFCQ